MSASPHPFLARTCAQCVAVCVCVCVYGTRYNPMGHVPEMQRQAAKVNKMINMWNSKADNAPAGSYTDY